MNGNVLEQLSAGVKLILFLLITALAAGCASVSTDPDEGGLLGGIKGLSTGEYEQRRAAREQRLAALQRFNKNLKEEQDTLDESITIRKGDIERLEANLDDLGKVIESLRSDIEADSRVGSKVETARLQIQTKLELIELQLEELRAANEQGLIEKEALQREYRRLDKEAEQLWELYADLI